MTHGVRVIRFLTEFALSGGIELTNQCSVYFLVPCAYLIGLHGSKSLTKAGKYVQVIRRENVLPATTAGKQVPVTSAGNI